MKVTIDLLGASDEQRARFALPSLATTLESIRNVLGDDSADVVAQWGPGTATAVHHVVQSATVFVTIPGPGLVPSNTYPPRSAT